MQESQKGENKNEFKKEGKPEGTHNTNPSSEFKIALAAMCSEDDYELLQKQFSPEN